MSAAKTIICRLLVVLTAWTPFQLAHAGMIGAGQTAATAAVSMTSERAAVSGFLARADVARELQALGIDAAAAQERAAAMSDADARVLAGEIQSQPAGGNVEGVALWAIVIFVIWYIFWGQYKPR